MIPVQWAILILVAISAPAVAFARQPINQVIALSYYGVVLSLMFLFFKAPDVALSQIVIGTIALPLMVLLALGKIRENQELRERGEKRKKKGEEAA